MVIVATVNGVISLNFSVCCNNKLHSLETVHYYRYIIVHVCVSSSFIILVTSLLLLYILHQYNHHYQPIQAIDQGLYHTDLVCNNYTGDYPIQVEDDPYC